MPKIVKIVKKYKKIFSSLSFIGGSGLVFSESYYSVYGGPALREVVEAQGFKLLLEIKRDPFNRWKRTFLINKDDLIKEAFIPDLNSDTTDSEGAVYLKDWCEERLDSNNWDNLTLWRARRYCTVTLGVEILEEDAVDLIEVEDEAGWKNVFTEFKDIIFNSKAIRDFDINERTDNNNIALLKDWCANKLNQSFTKESEKDRENVRSWCLTLNTLKYPTEYEEIY